VPENDDEAAERSLWGTASAYRRWSKTDRQERTAQTQPMRDAYLAQLAQRVDPEGTMDPLDRAEAVQRLLKAQAAEAAAKSVAARRQRKLDRLNAQNEALVDQAGGAA
jgi:hypothetical protein